MGNASAKQLAATELAAGTLQADDGKSIAKAFVFTEATIKIKNKGKTWVKYSDDEGEGESLLWTYKHVGWFKKHTVVSDAQGELVAVIITHKKGMTSCTNYVIRTVPAYDEQEPVPAEDLEKAGIQGDNATKSWYGFAKIDSRSKLTTAKCTYELTTGKDSAGQDEFKPLYTGEKLSSVGFKALFNEGDKVVGKAHMSGMKMNLYLEAAAGTDLLAIVSMGYALAGDESGAGGLAGAGVV